MGTVIGIDVRDRDVRDPVIDEAFGRFRAIDERFSTFRTDSEVSRYGRGEVRGDDLSDELREVLGLCEVVRVRSDGVFDIRRHRADGVVDPSGLVKGWAVEEAVAILHRAGARNFAVNAGGDIVARGEPVPGRAWRVGLQHPEIREAIAAVLDVRDLAVATSGAYERGDHVINPRTGAPPTDLLSATVAGPSLTFADAYATAAFAMGIDGIRWVAGLPGYEGCVITTDRRFIWTDGFEELLARTGIDGPTQHEAAGGAAALAATFHDPARTAH
jgi:thiamine biosynthesis lipoprotein